MTYLTSQCLNETPAICGKLSFLVLEGKTNPKSMVGDICNLTSTIWFRISGKPPSS